MLGLFLGLAVSFQIPSAKIDVPLYYSHEQSVCDAKDSACFYNSSENNVDFLLDNWIIADHRTQDFKTLYKVKAGDTAYIINDDDSITTLECIEVCEGTADEYGYIYVDDDYMENRYEDVYIAYTCKKQKDKRLITYWKEITQ